MEQECEDTLFELSDTRERYPAKCSGELAKCIKLTTQINVSKSSPDFLFFMLSIYKVIYLFQMKPVKLKEHEKLQKPVITNNQQELFEKTLSKKNEIDDPQKWKKMNETIVNLKIVLEQIENEKSQQIIQGLNVHKNK